MTAPATDAGAYELLERARWGGPPTACPHCGVSGRCYFLQPAHRGGRPTRTGTVSGRRVWKCAACRRQFSVLVGTIMQGTRLELAVWIGVVAELAGPGPTPSPADLSARYGISTAAAGQVVRRLELALAHLRSPGSDRDWPGQPWAVQG